MSINHQFIKETVRAHYLMQLGTYISELTDLSGVRFSYNSHFNDIWYNSAYDIQIEASEVDELIQTVNTYMSSRNRPPAIYVSPATKPYNLGTLLEARGYEKVETEVWLFYDFSQPPKSYTCPAEVTILDVKTDADFEIFADVYRRTSSSPEVDLHVQAYIDRFKYKPKLIDTRYFVVSYHGEPVGISSLLMLGEYGGIYIGASLEKFRRQGFMRFLMYHIASVAEEKGVKYLFLQVTAGKSGEKAAQKMGYSRLYVRECYRPKSVIDD